MAVCTYAGANPEFTVVVAPATAVPAAHYRRFAQWLAERGTRVVLFDYRGVGRSDQRPPGTDFSIWHWGRYDLDAVLRATRAEHVGAPSLVLGHSIGGLIAAYAPTISQVPALLLVNAQSCYWRDWSTRGKLRYMLPWWVGLELLPRVLGHYPGRQLGLSIDLPLSAAREWSLAVHRPDFTLGRDGQPRIAPDGRAHRAAFHAYAGKIVAYSFSDDEICSQRAAARLLAHFARAEKEHRHRSPKDYGVTKIGHFGLARASAAVHLWPELQSTLRALAALAHPRAITND